ncbi:hypothetical protein VTO73DRAFT_10082 [Trametes versicolor]
MSARAPLRPQGFDGAPAGGQTVEVQQPRSLEPPAAPSTEDANTALLRLPSGLAREIMALAEGASVGGVEYVGQSEDGCYSESESLPGYESEPSATERCFPGYPNDPTGGGAPKRLVVRFCRGSVCLVCWALSYTWGKSSQAKRAVITLAELRLLQTAALIKAVSDTVTLWR